MDLSIRIPRPDQERYLRGGCFVFARELQGYVRRETGVTLPLMALWVDGQPHHAFLVDWKAGCAYDARGRVALTVDAVSAGSRVEGMGEIRALTVAQMRTWARHMDPHNARIDIARYVVAREEESE